MSLTDDVVLSSSQPTTASVQTKVDSSSQTSTLPPSSSSSSEITAGQSSNLSQSSEAAVSSTSTSSQNAQNVSCLPIDASDASSQALGSLQSANRPYTPTLTTPSLVNGSQSPVSTPTSGVSNSPVRGSKRAIDGAVKPQTSAALASAQSTGGHIGRDRKASESSTGSRISELSSQLKTRLSYAMVKVQNGWEHQSIDEVENLASQMTSPITLRSPHSSQISSQSPRATMSSVNRRSGELTQIVNQSVPPTARHTSRPMSHWTKVTPAFGTMPESCERTTATNGPRKLAPAPELVPSSVRSVPSNGNAASKQMQSYVSRSMTPTQQEQDAVDSLLLMGSPANSQPFHGPAGPGSQTSPKKSHLAGSPPRRRNGIISTPHRLVNGVSASSEEDLFNSRLATMTRLDMEREAKRRSLGANVEQLLDQMAETSSDEDLMQISPTEGQMAARREASLNVRN